MKKKRIADGLQAWIDARKRHHLSHAHVQMARELGMNPKRLGGLDNHRQERWKLPLPLFIEELYRKRFGRARPEFVLSIEERARQQERKRAEKREAKLRRRESAAGEVGATVGKVAEPGRCLPLEIYGEDRLPAPPGPSISAVRRSMPPLLHRDRYTSIGMVNVFFALTEEFNSDGVIALLASGQAVVFYRIALMSKDGDWVLKETESACRRVRSVLASHGARYRPGAPLDPRWLAGGWSCHFEFFDDKKRRIRCDFVSRPPRIPAADIETMFSAAHGEGALRVVDPGRLVLLKQTQRAKDYPVIGELARLLPSQSERELTTDPDRILELAMEPGGDSARESVRLARLGRSREEVVAALAGEVDRLQRADRARMQRYEGAAQSYLAEFRATVPIEAPLEDAHAVAVRLAERSLPTTLEGAAS